jgi:hypothetical protein
VVELTDPVMIVVGGGAIALSTAQELCALQTHRVVVLWTRDPDFARAVETIGAAYIVLVPTVPRHSTEPGSGTPSPF